MMTTVKKLAKIEPDFELTSNGLYKITKIAVMNSKFKLLGNFIALSL